MEIEELKARFSAQKAAFAGRNARTYGERIDALESLLGAVLRFEDKLVESLNQDFGNRASQETRLLEIFPVVDEIRHSKRHLKAWMKPERVSTNWQFSPSRAYIMKQPLGVVGIMGAWNYQILLTLSPLVNVLAAGNHALIKPASAAPATAEVLAELIASAFPADYVSVVTGGPEIGSAFSGLPFDHIIFTGSGRVGRIVMREAAANLTPVTLELGGKSPALVHDSYPIAKAADRICGAKFWNAGQTCVAPDYALVPEAAVSAFLDAAIEVVRRRLPSPSSNGDYTRMINAAGWERMRALVEDARAKGAKVVQVHAEGERFEAAHRAYPPTLVVNVREDMRIMQEEIFGPILPIVGHRSLDEAIRFVNERDRPLAFYYFDDDFGRVRNVLERTTAGGVTVNDCIFHLPQNNLPFGGVGPSGMGAYHGEEGFNTFSNRKGVMVMSRVLGWLLATFFKPPYNKWSDRVIGFLIWRRK